MEWVPQAEFFERILNFCAGNDVAISGRVVVQADRIGSQSTCALVKVRKTMAYVSRLFRVVLAVWLAVLSPLWCCCTGSADPMGELPVKSQLVSTPHGGCSSCPSSEQDLHTRPGPSDQGEPCDCNGHHRDVQIVVGEFGAPSAWASQAPPVLMLSIPATTDVLPRTATLKPRKRGYPPGSRSSSLFSLHALLLV